MKKNFFLHTMFFLSLLPTILFSQNQESDLHVSLEEHHQAMVRFTEELHKFDRIGRHIEDTKSDISNLESVLNEVDQTLDYLDSPDFLQKESESLTGNIIINTQGKIEPVPTSLKFNGERMFILRFNDEWIVDQNPTKANLTDTYTGETFKPLPVYHQGKQVYLQTKDINHKPTPDKNQELKTYNVYPNPSSNRIRIGGLKSDGPFKIYDANGRLIKSDLTTEGECDISNLPKGYYFINVENQTLSFIKI